jgi:hypothetical protein
MEKLYREVTADVTTRNTDRAADHDTLDHPTPWRGRFWNYEERGGMRVPLDGEVAWMPPEGAKPYWRGGITETAYEFAQ